MSTTFIHDMNVEAEYLPIIHHFGKPDYYFIKECNTERCFTEPISLTPNYSIALKFDSYDRCCKFCNALSHVFMFHDFYTDAHNCCIITVGTHIKGFDAVEDIVFVY